MPNTVARPLTWSGPGQTVGLAAAIKTLHQELPGWWWSVGNCHVSADASIGPDRSGPDRHLLELHEFDEGFHVDLPHPATSAESLLEALSQAKSAKNRLVGTPAKPRRIQRMRTKGYRMPANTVSVTRPGKHGNPFYAGCGIGYGRIHADGSASSSDVSDPVVQVRWFRTHMDEMKRNEPGRYADLIKPLVGKNVACWCKLNAPCHGDVWLELAKGGLN